MPALLALLIATVAYPAEQKVFTCRIGDRTATVVQEGPDLVYRSSRLGGLELQVPGGHVSRESFSGGGELQAVFRNGPWTYVVYERTIRTGFHGGNDPRFEAGVDVLRRGRVVSRRRCFDGNTQFDQKLTGTAEDGFVEH